MESLVMELGPDNADFETAVKDYSKNITPSETSTEESLKEKGALRQEDPNTSTEQVPSQDALDQGECPKEMEETFNNYDDYYNPMDDYYLFSVDDGPLDLSPGRYDDERADDSEDKRAAEETQGASKNPDLPESFQEHLSEEERFEKNGAPEEVVQEQPAQISSTESLGEEQEPVCEKDALCIPDMELKTEEFVKGDPVEGETTPDISGRNETTVGKIGESGAQAASDESLSVGTPVKREEIVDEEISVDLPLQSLVDSVKEEVVVEDVPSDENSEFPTANETSEDIASSGEAYNGVFSTTQLKEIWELATKLCEARCKYNSNVCRSIPEVLKPQPRKRPPARVLCRPRPKLPDPMTNNGVCTIGKGNNWHDPPEWDWGQPLPDEIRDVIPTKPPPETVIVSLSDDECAIASSSKWHCGASVSKKFEPLSFSKNSKHTFDPITLDSDDELPDFSVELGIVKKQLTPPTSFGFGDFGSVVVEPTNPSVNCSVIAVEPLKLTPTTRLGARKRKNRGRGGNQTAESYEVVTLGSSDDSDDGEVEVVPAPKKPAPAQVPAEAPEQKTPTPTGGNSSNEWSCPICFETKDKVPGLMSTICGHIFCAPCLQSTVKLNKQCPTCRKKLTLRQIHNLYM